MPILDTQIHFHLTGSSSQSDPDLSLGGRISEHIIVSAASTELYGDITGLEAVTGKVKYRCFAVQVASTTLPWQTPYFWISQNTPSPGTSVKVGLDPVGLYSTAVTILDETCAPSGVSFTTPTSGAPLTVANVPSSSYFFVWTELTVSAGTTGYSTDSFIIKFEGGSDA